MSDAERFRMAKITLERWHIDDDGSVRTDRGVDVVTAFDHRVVATDADLRAIVAVPELLRLADAVIAAGPAVPQHIARLAHVAQAFALGEIKL